MVRQILCHGSRQTGGSGVKQAYDCLTKRKGQPARDILAGVRACYEAGVTDEFLPPMVVSQEGKISAGDSVIFFNFPAGPRQRAHEGAARPRLCRV